MTETKTLDIQPDENDDLYKDIGDFHFDRELAKLEESNRVYLEDIERLSQQVKLLNEENTELRKVNDILGTNISVLLKTAKTEISRKQLVIDEFRKKVECVNKKNSLKVDEVRVLEVCKICGSRESKNDGGEVEEGEIVRSDNEENMWLTEKGTRWRLKHKDNKDQVESHERNRGHERSRGRSIDNYSSRNQRFTKHSDEAHTQSSAKNGYRHRSPDERRYSDRREKSRDKSVFSSNHSHGVSRRRQEYPSRERKDLRRSQERHRSHRRRFSSREKENSPKHKPEYKTDRKSVETVDSSSSKFGGMNENKSKDVKFHSDNIKNRTGKRENDKPEEKCEPVKQSESNETKDKKIGGPNVKKKCETNSFERQSVLAGLYDETFYCDRFSDPPKPENQGVTSEINNEAAALPDSSSDDSWSLCFGEKTEPPKKKQTLYSKRMEAKLKKKIKEEELAAKVSDGVEDCEKVKKFEEKCLDEKLIYSQSEKEEGEITLNDDEINSGSGGDTTWKGENAGKCEELPAGNEIPAQQEKVSEKVEKNCEESGGSVSEEQQQAADKNFEQSLGENIIKNLLLLQKPEGNQEIKEYSPLKNNYKLSKLSPPKPDPKQHILDYYNLKPAQQINNIEPEILNFSLSMPETPGKNFPFGTLDNRELVREYGDCNPEQQDEEKISDNPEDNKKNAKEDNKEMREDKGDNEDVRSDLKSETEEKDCNLVNKEKKKKSPSPKQKEKRGKVKGKTSSKITALGSKKKNKDAVTYQIRTRSKTGKESKGVKEDGNGKSNGRIETKSKSATTVKRKRERASSDEDGKEKGKRKKTKSVAKSVAKSEESKNERPEGEEEKEEEEGEREMKSEISQSNDITYFEVFQSVSDVGNGVAGEEKTVLDDLSLSNISDCRATTNTTGSDVSNKFKNSNESKGSLLSGGNSDDSSTFKVLRSYLMLSANDESDLDVFSEDTSSSSGDYSDSGASAFVDLL